jgi:hypothetical protein
LFVSTLSEYEQRTMNDVLFSIKIGKELMLRIPCVNLLYTQKVRMLRILV